MKQKSTVLLNFIAAFLGAMYRVNNLTMTYVMYQEKNFWTLKEKKIDIQYIP